MESACAGACADAQPAAPLALGASAKPGLDAEAHDLTCAICLETIALADLSVIKGCEHAYCGKCILSWAMHKDPAWCPQCKAPFTRLVTYRALDGTLSDFPAEESVCLLKRACWFQAHLREAEKVAAAVPAALLVDAADAAAIAEAATERSDYGRYYEEYDDDEEVEAYYFSAAAGRARITLGNRRFGNNGYIAAGRMQARPAPPARPAKGKATASAKGESSGAGAGPSGTAGRSPPAASPAFRSSPVPPATPAARAGPRAAGMPSTAGTGSPSANSALTPPPRPRGPGDTTVRRNSGGAPARKGPSGGRGSGGRGGGGGWDDDDELVAGGGSGAGSAGKNQGRRARRNAQRAAMDARGGLASP